jgi:hypothetical protein
MSDGTSARNRSDSSGAGDEGGAGGAGNMSNKSNETREVYWASVQAHKKSVRTGRTSYTQHLICLVKVEEKS